MCDTNLTCANNCRTLNTRTLGVGRDGSASWGLSRVVSMPQIRRDSFSLMLRNGLFLDILPTITNVERMRGVLCISETSTTHRFGKRSRIKWRQHDHR